MAQERIALFDNVKGVAIALVVIGHVATRLAPVYGSHFVQATMAFIWTFHMPLFIFCSGLFAGRSWYKSRRAPVDKVLLYLILYVVFILLVMVLELGVFGKDTTVNPFDISGAPWFMLTLAAYMLMVPLIGSVNPVAFVVASVLVATLGNYYLTSATVVSILRILVYLPYFALGFYLQPQRITQFVEAVKSRVRGWGGVVHLCSLLVLVALFVGMYLVLSDAQLTFVKQLSSGQNLFAGMAKRYGCPVAVLAATRIIEYPLVTALIALVVLATPVRRLPVLTALGQRSFQVYIVHMLLMYAIDRYNAFGLVVSASPWWALSPWALGAGLAVLLSLPKAPNEWVRRLGSWCKRVTTQP